jgi:parallel beta-helix repeat protein
LASGVSIGASNIYLDCNGATLDGTAAGTNTAITSTDRQNVTIRHCRIINYNKGIVLTRSHNFTMQSINMTPSITGTGARGIQLINSSDNHISRSNLTTDGSGGTTLYLLTGSKRNLIEHNIVSMITAVGTAFPYLVEANSDKNIFRYNIMSSSSMGSDNVITIQTGSDNNIIDHNNLTVTSTSGVKYGIRPDNVVGTNITFNRIIEGTGSNNLGSLNVNADKSFISNNFIRTFSNDGYGLLLTSGSVGTVIQFNNITTTGASNSPAIQLDTNSNNVVIKNNSLSVGGANPHILLARITNATIQDNTFRGTNTAISDFTTGFPASNYTLIIGSMIFRDKNTTTTRVSTNAVFSSSRVSAINSSLEPSLNRSAIIIQTGFNPIFMPQIIRNTQYRTTENEIRTNGIVCPANICKLMSFTDGTLTFNVTSFSSFFSSPCTNVTSSAGRNVTASVFLCGGTYTLGGTIGINILAPNVIVQCNGTTIIDGGAGVGIQASGFNNVTINNCKIKKYNTGIFFFNSNNSEAFNNTLLNMTNLGISVFKANDARILNNRLENQTSSSNGVFSSSGNTISGVLIRGNVFRNIPQRAIFVDGGSRSFRIENNIMQNINTPITGIGAIDLEKTRNINVTNNTFIVTNDAVVIDRANNTLLRSNRIIRPANDGILLTTNSRANIITQNIIINATTGIESQSAATRNNITGNLINGSTSTGITLSDSGFNRIESNNIFGGVNTGLFLSSSPNNIVRNNIIRNNTARGIRADSGSNYNNIINNILSSSAIGTLLSAVHNNTIDNNTYSNNAKDILGIGTSRNTLIIRSRANRLTFINTTLDVNHISSNFFLNNSIVAVNTSAETAMNKSARISTVMSTPAIGGNIFVKEGFLTNVDTIIATGQICPPTRCGIESFNLVTGDITFNVTRFSSYGISTYNEQTPDTDFGLSSVAILITILMMLSFTILIITISISKIRDK